MMVQVCAIMMKIWTTESLGNDQDVTGAQFCVSRSQIDLRSLQLHEIRVVTNPSTKPEGMKLSGRSKALLNTTTVANVLWKDGNILLDFRLRGIPVIN